MPMDEHLLVVYDDYSRYPIESKVSSTSAKVVTKKLEEIFTQFGIPEVVKSDKGPPFQSYDFKHFAEDMNFKHRKITPLWPQANGGVERFMKTLKRHCVAQSPKSVIGKKRCQDSFSIIGLRHILQREKHPLLYFLDGLYAHVYHNYKKRKK